MFYVTSHLNNNIIKWNITHNHKRTLSWSGNVTPYSFIHDIWKKRHTTMSLTKRKRSLIISKSMLKEQGKYMGHNPKRVIGTWGSNPR